MAHSTPLMIFEAITALKKGHNAWDAQKRSLLACIECVKHHPLTQQGALMLEGMMAEGALPALVIANLHVCM